MEFLDPLYLRDSEKFRQFFQYVLRELIDKSPVTEYQRVVRLGLEPFAGFNQFLRELNVLGFDYDAHRAEVVPTIGHTKEDTEIETELEKMLDELDPKYCGMLRGAWESFLSYNPDKYRQTLVSIRELTYMVIDQLAPTGENRKEKIRVILASETERDLVESLTGTVDELIRIQSKLHAESDYESTLFALKTTEYLLFFLLKRARKTFLAP